MLSIYENLHYLQIYTTNMFLFVIQRASETRRHVTNASVKIYCHWENLEAVSLEQKPGDSPIVWNTFPWSSVFHHDFSLYLWYTAIWHCLALKSWWGKGSRSSFAFPSWGLHLRLGWQQKSNFHMKNSSNPWDFKETDKKILHFVVPPAITSLQH